MVENLSKVQAYGLEDTVLGSGYVKGWIDADFLHPLPARTGFEETPEWLGLIDALEGLTPLLKAEVEEHKARDRERETTEVERRAVQIAREILDLDDFRDLELPGGLSKARAAASTGAAVPPGEKTAERSHDPGDRRDPRGPRINYVEMAFPEGARRHSKFVTGNVLANTLNKDYQHEASLGPWAKLSYATLLIGKEAIACNDKSGAADELLEKLLSFHFRLRDRIEVRPPHARKAQRSRTTASRNT